MWGEGGDWGDVCVFVECVLVLAFIRTFWRL